MNIKKIALISGISIIVLILAVIYILFFAKGTLIVKINVDNATVLINKKSYKAPLNIKLRAGDYSVIAFKEGYAENEENISIKAFKTTSISIELEPNDIVEPTKAHTLAAIYNNLPFNGDDFNIFWDDSNLSISVAPNIPFDSSQAPNYFFETYWNQYQQNAQKAYDWLEENGLGKDVREANGIDLIWWGEEWWPEGASLNL